ncbi:Methionine--tRNA ligase protein [Halorhabdus tiamatea SARL4B]|uniref:Methionine--tRNA ligase n=1 Tax=Halorhabdus tiamatea SARL4B TaxID=1033806 RepID=F7PQQ2_9EURY|nr:methionine--tRNA ligase [Halorhabdus tiamatea]ERJ04725.1 Methionine--tRNA ligase protein [Halorhabdus tiamatea SARL4B]CCQ34695.1 methionyl-tRNA synthetase [Halorhabdus tiamatea SARL4B]
MSHEEFPTDNPAVVTCGLPYANGDLHIGHLRTYVGGDVLTRSLEKLGQQTAFVSGSDMHGTPIAVQAIQDDIDPEAFALEYHEQYKQTFPRFDVDFDNYGHTHQETNRELTHEIVESLEREGYVEEQAIKVAWDPAEDQPLPDRYVEGTCPYCGAKARGDECDEGCGRHLEPGEIEDPVSKISGNPAEYRDRTHKFFTVSKLADYLSQFLDRLEGTPNARNQPRQWIEEGLQDWCITRDLDWGFDYPDDEETVAPAEQREGAGETGEQDLVLYVWVDAPIEYIASTKQYTDRVGAETFDWEDAWTDSGELVHVIGRDIIQHHTIFWPAMLHVAEYNEPRAVVASGFMSLDGDAFSTSRNRAIWAREYLEEGFHPDLLRYYLTTVGGFQDDIDFSWNRFRERVNGELVGTVGNFAYRSLLFAYRNYEGTPEAEVSTEVEDRIEDAIADFETSVNDYSIRKATQAAVKLASFGNEYIQRHEPWNLADDEAAPVIRDCVQIAKAVAVLLQPTTPETSRRLWEQLGEDGDVAAVTLDAALEAPPATFGEPTELFEKIPEERVEELNEKLEERVAEASSDTDADETESDDSTEDQETDMDLEALTEDRISFDDFQELDIRVGEIVEAEPIEDSDDLVRLEVDIGLETRQVVAGIKQLHDVETLPGTRVVLLANMEKAELFGYESNGMVLAAGEEADLLTTQADAPLGSKIR